MTNPTITGNKRQVQLHPHPHFCTILSDNLVKHYITVILKK